MLAELSVRLVRSQKSPTLPDDDAMIEDNDEELYESDYEEHVSYDSDASMYGNEQENGKRKRASGSKQSPNLKKNKRDSEEDEEFAPSSSDKQSTRALPNYTNALFITASQNVLADFFDLQLAQSRERLVRSLIGC